MLISDGSYVVSYAIPDQERLLKTSSHDVEEISKQATALNPINLFVLGSKFKIGRLYLTDKRLILLPFSKHEVKKAERIQDVGHKLIGKTSLNVPKAKIEFDQQILQIPLDQIESLDPYQKQFFVHPTLKVFLPTQTLRFKFVPTESPQEWAESISQCCGCDIKKVVA